MSTVSLSIHEIGRTGHPDATEVTEHTSVDAAVSYLCQRFGLDNIRGGMTGGTIGSNNGRVFQASKVWSIR